MKSITLTEKEIEGLNSFTTDMSEIPVVESVYIVPYSTEKGEEEKVDVVSIWNTSLYYSDLISEGRTYKDFNAELEAYNLKKAEYLEAFRKGRLTFSSMNSGDYSLALMHRREWIALQSLSNGIILFDRFGRTNEKKESLGTNFFEPYKNILQIENIDRLSIKIGEEKPLGLGKTIKDQQNS